MSNSYKKKAIFKDPSNPYMKRIFYRVFRRKIKQLLKSGAEIFPDKKQIMNQYNICDWKSNCINNPTCYCIRTYGRKKCMQK